MKRGGGALMEIFAGMIDFEMVQKMNGERG